MDAILAKENLGTRITDAPWVIGLGPGFRAGIDAHLVVETQRGHNLGRLYNQGEAEPNTGVPGTIGGFSGERVLRAPVAGILRSLKAIGDGVEAGEVVAEVDGIPVPARIPGVLRGLIRSGTPVTAGTQDRRCGPAGNPPLLPDHFRKGPGHCRGGPGRHFTKVQSITTPSLIEALALGSRELISLVGAGGKTTLMFALAEELRILNRRVVTTTTTKIVPPAPEESPRLLTGRTGSLSVH